MKFKLVAVSVAMLATSVAFAQNNDTLAKIKASGTISLGVRDASALSYTLGNGKYVGFHTEMAERIIDDLGKKIGKPLTVNHVLVTSQNRVPLVQNGTVDIECGSTTNNAARAKDVAFAYNTYMEVVRMAVKTNSGIKDLKDLNGKTVATTTGTTSVQILRRNERAHDINFKEVTGKDHSDSFLLLEAGRADAFVMDASILAANIAKAKNPKDFAIVGPELSIEPIACMVRKDDPKFLEAVDESIARQVKDGSLAKLYDKWMVKPVPPNNVSLNLPLSSATKEAWANLNNKPAEDFIKK